MVKQNIFISTTKDLHWTEWQFLVEVADKIYSSGSDFLFIYSSTTSPTPCYPPLHYNVYGMHAFIHSFIQSVIKNSVTNMSEIFTQRKN